MLKYQGSSSAASGVLSIVGFPFHCLSSVQLQQYFNSYMTLQRGDNSGEKQKSNNLRARSLLETLGKDWDALFLFISAQASAQSRFGPS